MPCIKKYITMYTLSLALEVYDVENRSYCVYPHDLFLTTHYIYDKEELWVPVIVWFKTCINYQNHPWSSVKRLNVLYVFSFSAQGVFFLTNTLLRRHILVKQVNGTNLSVINKPIDMIYDKCCQNIIQLTVYPDKQRDFDRQFMYSYF